MKASWAEGHAINAGLPEALPDWLHAIRARPHQLDRLLRLGEPHGTRTRVDWAQTLKRWARRGHSDAALVWNRMPYGPGRLVVLWDVSGSMANYVEWYFPWLYWMAQQRSDVHVFGFGTAVEDLTMHLHCTYGKAVRSLYQETNLWGSGTAMGRAFQEWNSRFGPRLLGTGSTILIISDGWDVGRPEDLEDALRRMAQRSRTMWWVNPLMVTAGFEPKTRALKVALHYTEHMDAGATADDLRALSWRLGFGT